MTLKFVIPKGRIQKNVVALLEDVGLTLKGADRSYRPTINDPDMEIKLLKAQNIPPLIAMGQHDCGFAGADWVREQQADVETVLDLGFDPVRIVAAIPEDWDWERVKQRKLIAVSEYRRLTTEFLEKQGVDFTFIRAYGATEVFPPEDADVIVDNSATGSTLRANRLKIVGEVMRSATCFVANKRALDDPAKREKIENLKLLFKGVLTGRERVLLEMNCGQERLDDVVAMLPAMKSPTISKLYGEDGFAIKAAVPRSSVKDLVPRLISAGASDILELQVQKVLP